MTSLGHLVNMDLRVGRERLDDALKAIRDYQRAVAALADLPEAEDHREWALAMVDKLQGAWSALDSLRWTVPPFPGQRQT